MRLTLLRDPELTSPSSRPTRILSRRDAPSRPETARRRRDRRARRYFAYQKKRAVELPPPTKPNRISIECYGLTMPRGGGWIGSCLCGNRARSTPSTRRLLDGVAMPVPHRSMAPDTLVDFHTGYCDASGKQTVHELTPNMTGFHVLELDVHATKGITLCREFRRRRGFA